MNDENVQAITQVASEDKADMPIEEYRRLLTEAERRAHVAENEAALLRECIVRMSLERYGLLR